MYRLESELEVSRALLRWGEVQARRQGCTRAQVMDILCMDSEVLLTT